MAARWDRTINALLALSAVAMAVALLHREFGKQSRRAPEYGPPERVKEWSEILSVGRFVGEKDARVKLVEFGDFECPFCANFNSVVQGIRRKYPRDVALVFVHWPLPSHRFAHGAARAAECAAKEGRFGEMVDGLYSKQDSFGLKSWVDYALEAGVRDTARFLECSAARASMPSVEAGVSLASRLNLSGTPTVMLNGWRFTVPPDQSELDRAVTEFLAGREPYK